MTRMLDNMCMDARPGSMESMKVTLIESSERPMNLGAALLPVAW